MRLRFIYLVLFNLIVQTAYSLASEGPMSANACPLLVISCSLNPHSRSALLAKEAYDALKSKGCNVSMLDLRTYHLPLANGHDQSAYADPHVKDIHDRILNAKGIIIASPIYNYSIAATTKNLFELTSHPYKQVLSGTAWKNKVVGFIGTSGSPRSLLSFLPFLNSLMMDAKVTIVPHFVIATRDDFKGNGPAQDIKQKTGALAADVHRVTQALSGS